MGATETNVDRGSLHAGTTIAERYRLVERLGTGGMGAVWRATHMTLAHDVAIKFLQVHDISNDARARFEREAKLAARLGEASRHITRVIDYGVLGATPYLVMELLHGETLSQRLRRERTISLELAAKMIAQLCRALQVAHGAGVIHRDLKPSNIFLARSEFQDEVIVKLMDFGVAKSTEVSDDGEETTGAGTIIGTPGYMSPEQIMCKRLDARTDLWGVGATVYRVLCGRSPFGQGSIAELGLRIVATDPLPPTTVNPALPRAIDAWMDKALAKSPEERFQSARDLADALRLISGTCNDEEPVVGAIVPLADETLPPDRISVPRDEPPTRIEGRARPPSRGARSLVWLVAALAIGIAIERTRSHGGDVAASPVVIAPPIASAPAPVTVVAVAKSVSATPSAAASAPRWKPVTSPKPKPKQVDESSWYRRDEL